MDPSEALISAIAVTAELTGTQLSKAGARVLAGDLARYPEVQVLGALERCRRELRGRLTIADVIARLDDGRPGPEEAWAVVYRALEDERVTVVWTEEMAQASAASRVIIGEDRVGARMAFLEQYRQLVAKARDAGMAARWSPCLGWDVLGREGPVREAVRLGRISEGHAMALLPPSDSVAVEVSRLSNQVAGKLTHEVSS